MGILVGVAAGVLVLVLLCFLSGDGGRSYEEYRRAEYRNEYLWETRTNRDNGNYFLDAMRLRRP